VAIEEARPWFDVNIMAAVRAELPPLALDVAQRSISPDTPVPGE
jgi:hypothetical protein